MNMNSLTANDRRSKPTSSACVASPFVLVTLNPWV